VKNGLLVAYSTDSSNKLMNDRYVWVASDGC